MASYAPLLAHSEAWQWKSDAIWFDNLRSFGTPNYYVQKVFAGNVGTRVLPVNSGAIAVQLKPYSLIVYRISSPVGGRVSRGAPEHD